MKELTKEVLKDIDNNSAHWSHISKEYILDESFIRKHQDKLSWYLICKYQTLSEDFIIEFKDKVNWINISIWQKLSEAFVLELKNKISIYYLIRNKELKNYSKETQKFILQETIEYIQYGGEYHYDHLTDYMKELYNKLSIML